MSTTVTLSHAKARLSEIVRSARTRGEETIITVDGEPAARVVGAPGAPRRLTDAEIATFRVLLRSLRDLDRVAGVFDATDLVGEGRR